MSVTVDEPSAPEPVEPGATATWTEEPNRELAPEPVIEEPRAEIVQAPPPTPAALPEERRTRALRDLSRIEVALLQTQLDAGHGLHRDDVDRLRYLLGLARLTAFEPGAALTGRCGVRADLDVGDEVAPFRRRVIDGLAEVREALGDQDATLRAAGMAVSRLWPHAVAERQRLIDRYSGICSPAELDAEAGTRVLVNAAGGGGGAGFVYLGAQQRLDERDLTARYVIGASIGALLGVFRARHLQADWPALLDLARTADRRNLFGAGATRRRFGMPGLRPLRLRSSFDHFFTEPDGRSTTIADLEVAYEAVVAGVRRRPFQKLPAAYRADVTETPDGALPQGRTSPLRLAPALAQRMWQVAAFFDARVVEPVVLGADPDTRKVRALDAAGFSAAIPGVLHYDLTPGDDHPGAGALERLMAERDLAALVDGGVVANVPSELAWRRVQAGRLGTRNAIVLAFDCFHPRWDPRHLWLQPVTQGIGVQMRRQMLFTDVLVRFSPTLSPINLVPSDRALEQSLEWGRASVERALPLIGALLAPLAYRW